MFGRIRRYFFTGLVVLLPTVLTLYIIFVVFRFADSILGRFINSFLQRWLGFSIPGLGILLSLIIIILAGFLATRLFLKRFFLGMEKALLRLPLTKRIYPAVKQIINFVLQKEGPSLFKKVILVEYPRKGIWSLGFVTNEGFKEAKDKTGQDVLNIFLPNSPSPLSGFYMLVPKSEIIFLDLPVEDGIRLIISGGVFNPGSNP